MSELEVINDKRWASVSYYNTTPAPQKIPNITIEDGAGEFSILIDKERFRFEKEDTHLDLVKVFDKLGFKAKYKEVY